MASIFRKDALLKISSTEQLDKLIVISSPATWMYTIGMVIIVVTIIFWSFIGTIPNYINITGVFTNNQKFIDIFTESDGKIEVFVEKGDVIQKGDLVATIASVENENQKEIVSESNGVVSNIFVQDGQVITLGSKIIKISADTGTDEGIIVCYAPYSHEIKEGMLVTITPDDMKKEKSGHLNGVVKEVDKYNSTYNEMMENLGDENLVKSLIEQQSTTKITIELNKNTNSLSGYEWSNPRNNDVPIYEMSLVDLNIIIEEYAPITKLFPALK